MSQYIFVYGTLKRGGCNNSLLDGYEFVGAGRAYGCALLDFGAYPGMIAANVRDKDVSSVFGEVYAVPDEDWAVMQAKLDHLEHAWKLYLRVKIEVELVEGTKECTTYLVMATVNPEDIVQGGVWQFPVV